MNTRKSVRFVAAAALLLLSSTWLTAQKPQILPPHNAGESRPDASAAERRRLRLSSPRRTWKRSSTAFLPIQLQRDDIAGAVVLVVKDGKVLFAKGYGYSDVKSKKPVTVDATLFRPGSISKTFTWTAVMQLVEQGKLDLNRDVNDYLDFKIPATFGKPITMKDLMTHTPGFEETLKDLFVAKAADMRPLQEYVQHAPAGADISARNDACVLQLRRHAGRLHRAARLGHAVRRLHREEHPAAARHATHDLPSAAARQPEAADVAGLQQGVATGQGASSSCRPGRRAACRPPPTTCRTT